MIKNYLTLSFSLVCSFISGFLAAQTGCPGCQTALPANLPADTVYLPPIPDGQIGVYYDNDISFRMPKTTTPVAAIDSVTPPGLTISSIEILSVDGIPPGLSWEASQTTFPVATQTDGCIKICGTPTQSDSFVVTVRLKASILIFSQEATFPMRIYIAPGISQNDGFTMANPTGCGSTEVAFTNNVPSGGTPGYSYTWNFGDSTTYSGEQPPPHLYSNPGTYVVDYTAVIDTSPYTLLSVILLDLECVDLLGLGNPDVYLFVTDSSGTEVYNSGADMTDLSLPATINIGIPLYAGNYTMEIWDEDSGLKGGDDKCGIVSFNVLSNGNVVSGGFVGILNIIKPKITLHYTDTVVVYPSPTTPIVVAPKGMVVCKDDAPLPLLSSYNAHNQWYLNGGAISAAVDSIYYASESGFYQVAYTSADGCQSFSDSLELTIHPLPAIPLFSNNGKNLLLMFDTLNLPASYQLQWYQNGQALPGENGFWYCSMQSGTYSLQITDLITGCLNSFALNVVYNPIFDCTVGSEDLGFQAGTVIYPNPTKDILTIQLDQESDLIRLELFDMSGKLVQSIVPTDSKLTYQFNCERLPQGMYRLMVQTNKGVISHQVAIIK